MENVEVELDGLIADLIRLTAMSSIEWEAESDTQTFFYSVPAATVRIFPRDHDRQPPWVLEVLNQDGLRVGLSQSVDFIEETGEWQESSRADELDKLYRLAQDSALRISKTFGLLRESLNRTEAAEEDLQ